MARVSVNFKETGIDAISQAGRTRLGRVQSIDIGTNLPNTPIQEVGSDKLVGRIFDIPEVTVSVSAIDVGARTAFLMAGKDWDTAASGTVVELQDLDYVCLAQAFKSDGNDDIARTLYVPGAKIDSLSYNYSVGSDATEDYSFMATTQRWLRYDVAIASGTVTGGSVSLDAARQLKNGNYYLSVFTATGGYQPDEVVTASDANSVTFDTTKVPNGTEVVVTYHKDLSDQWDYTYEYPHVAPDYTPPPDQPVGVRGWGVEVFLVKDGESDNRIYRAQSCTVQAQYPTEKVQELGNESVVGYQDGIPEVTGTLELLQSDFSLQELLSGDTVGDNWDPNELGLGNWGLYVKVWRRGADRINTEPEKTIYIPQLDITQESNRTQVGQDVAITYNWSSLTNEMFIYKGDKPA